MVRTLDGRNIPKSFVFAQAQPDPMVGEDKAVGNMGYVMRTISLLANKIKEKIKKDPPSKALAKHKRRQPVLKGGLEINLEVDEDNKD